MIDPPEEAARNEPVDESHDEAARIGVMPTRRQRVDQRSDVSRTVAELIHVMSLGREEMQFVRARIVKDEPVLLFANNALGRVF